MFFFFQAEDGIRDYKVTGVQTCALPILFTKIPFLSDGVYGMWCAIVVNTWRGMPFFAITLLAGLQTINPDLHEAASLDGANGWQRFWHVTWPLLKPVTLVVVVFSIIQTFSDFQF